jgi:hypothetical protein
MAWRRPAQRTAHGGGWDCPRREEAGRAHGAGAGARYGGMGKAHRGGAGEDRGGGSWGDSTRGGDIPPRRCRSGPRTSLRYAAVGD